MQGSRVTVAEELAKQEFVSALPFLPAFNEKTLTSFYIFYATAGGCQ